MSSVCLASPSYRYAKHSNLYLLSSDSRIITTDAPKLEAVLQTLIDEWYDETFLISSVDDLRNTSTISQIADFGHSAIPQLVKEITRRPSYLFLALERIAKLNPVRDEDRGNIAAMCGAWIEWFQSKKSAFV